MVRLVCLAPPALPARAAVATSAAEKRTATRIRLEENTLPPFFRGGPETYDSIVTSRWFRSKEKPKVALENSARACFPLLACEVDPLAVARPDRRGREEVQDADSRTRQLLPPAPVATHPREDPVREQSDPLSAPRPGRAAPAESRPRAHAPNSAAAERNDPHAAVPLKRDRLTIRRPRRVASGPEAATLRAVLAGDRRTMLEARRGRAEDDPLAARSPPRRRALRLLRGRPRDLTYARAVGASDFQRAAGYVRRVDPELLEEQAATVGRPGRLERTIEQLALVRAVGVDAKDVGVRTPQHWLRFAQAPVPDHEHEPAAAGRPERPCLLARASRELVLPASVGVHQPDLRVLAVTPDVRDPAALRRQRRLVLLLGRSRQRVPRAAGGRDYVEVAAKGVEVDRPRAAAEAERKERDRGEPHS